AKSRYNLAQKFESFASKIGLLERYARDIATHHDKARADRVSPRENNRNNRFRLLCCENTYGSSGNKDIDFLLDELGNDLGCALAASIRPSNLDRDGVTLDPAGCTQPLHESGDRLILNRSRHWAQEPNGRQLRCLLRARRERPRDRAAEQCDELTPLHVGLAPLHHPQQPAPRGGSAAGSACHRADG